MAQWAVQTALGGYQSIRELVAPGGRLHESRAAILAATGAQPLPQARAARGGDVRLRRRRSAGAAGLRRPAVRARSARAEARAGRPRGELQRAVPQSLPHHQPPRCGHAARGVRRASRSCLASYAAAPRAPVRGGRATSSADASSDLLPRTRPQSPNLFRLPTDLTAHLRHGGTLVVPTRQRAARGAARVCGRGARRRRAASGRARTCSRPQAWLRREAERLAALDAGSAGRACSPPRRSGPVVARTAPPQAASGLVLLDHGALARVAAARQRARRRTTGSRLTAAAPDSEAGLLCEAQRVFEARCAALQCRPGQCAAPGGCAPARRQRRACSCAASMPSRRGSRPSPRPAAHPRARRRPRRRRRRRASCAPRTAARSWRRSPPGAARACRAARCAAARHAARARPARANASPRSSATRSIRRRCSRRGAGRARVVGIEGGEPFAELPLPAHALTRLSVLCGEELEFESLGRWLRGAALGGARGRAARRAGTHAARARSYRASTCASSSARCSSRRRN